MRNILLDAGPIIALFAVDDKHHARYDSLVNELSSDGLRLLTTWPCVVEASYLLGMPHRFEMLRWIELGGAVIYPFEPRHLGDIIDWMQTLHDMQQARNRSSGRVALLARRGDGHNRHHDGRRGGFHALSPAGSETVSLTLITHRRRAMISVRLPPP